MPKNKGPTLNDDIWDRLINAGDTEAREARIREAREHEARYTFGDPARFIPSTIDNQRKKRKVRQ